MFSVLENGLQVALMNPVMNLALLVVDDESSYLAMVCEYFGTHGYKVHAAQEYEEAEALLCKYSYSLVITDLCMTAVEADEGLHLIDTIKEKSPQTKIILLSGRVTAKVHEEALKRGAHAVLGKPQPLNFINDLAKSLLEVQS
jgi:DNA-binding NtrC family response regulator